MIKKENVNYFCALLLRLKVDFNLINLEDLKIILKYLDNLKQFIVNIWSNKFTKVFNKIKHINNNLRNL